MCPNATKARNTQQKTVNEQKLQSRWGKKLKAKNKDVFTRQDNTHCWSHLDQTFGENAHSKHLIWHWWTRSAVPAENKVTFHSWLALTKMTIPVSQDIFYCCLVNSEKRRKCEVKGCQLILIFQFQLNVRKGINLTADLPVQKLSDFVKTDSTDWTEHVARFTIN